MRMSCIRTCGLYQGRKEEEGDEKEKANGDLHGGGCVCRPDMWYRRRTRGGVGMRGDAFPSSCQKDERGETREERSLRVCVMVDGDGVMGVRCGPLCDSVCANVCDAHNTT